MCTGLTTGGSKQTLINVYGLNVCMRLRDIPTGPRDKQQQYTLGRSHDSVKVEVIVLKYYKCSGTKFYYSLTYDELMSDLLSTQTRINYSSPHCTGQANTT